MIDVLAANPIEINQNIFSPAGIFSNFGSLASAIILILTSTVAALSIIFIIIGGIKIVTSAGDQKKMASAQGTITYAIIGLSVAILAFVILKVVQFLIGSDVPIT